MFERDGVRRRRAPAGRRRSPRVDGAGGLARGGGDGGALARSAEVVGVAGFWLHLVMVLVFLNFLPHGKHFHVLTALPNVFFRALPPPSAALRKLDLESESAVFGTRTVADLSWKQGLDLYSCTECGRCQTSLPDAHHRQAAPHKEVNRALKHHLQEQAPALIALARARDAQARSEAAARAPGARRAGRSARRRSGPAPPAAGARRRARCSSRTSRGSSTCAASQVQVEAAFPTRRAASSRASRPRATRGASARTDGPSGARGSTSPARPRRRVRVPVLRRLRRRVRRPPEEGHAGAGADPARARTSRSPPSARRRRATATPRAGSATSTSSRAGAGERRDLRTATA